ncbi:MAG TPA: hypothetical protein VFU88_01685 [Ktedonobacterales bacterium]|nr:hypothetical protein [Ktedonobacterales bacterium]
MGVMKFVRAAGRMRLAKAALALALACLMMTGAVVAPAAASAARGHPAAPAAGGPRTVQGVGNGWLVVRANGALQIYYGSGTNFPQYGTLDLSSSYLRLVSGPTSVWGTSIILMPSFWSPSCPGDYCQGAPVSARTYTLGALLVVQIAGTIGSLTVVERLVIAPPQPNLVTAHLAAALYGTVTLESDTHPWEAFKPVQFSSMHDDASSWDASDVTADGQVYAFPAGQWILDPPVTASTFELEGGTSSWNPNAPTVTITLDTPAPLLVTGWLNPDTNHNDDNVAYWAATTTLLSSWSYDIAVTQAS